MPSEAGSYVTSSDRNNSPKICWPNFKKLQGARIKIYETEPGTRAKRRRKKAERKKHKITYKIYSEVDRPQIVNPL